MVNRSKTVWASAWLALALPAAAHAAQGGWAWAHNPQGTYAPYQRYSWNSSGGAIVIAQQGTGQYTVRFEGLGGIVSNGGNAHASAYGATGSCKVSRWSNDYSAVTVTVHCFTLDGQPMNGTFTVSFTRYEGSAPEKTGYVWQNLMSGSGTPSRSYQWHASGQNITADVSTDLLTVRFPDVGTGEHPDLLTAYGTDNSVCRIGSIHRGPRLTTEHWVLCRDATGKSLRRQFSLASGRRPLLSNTLAWAFGGGRDGRWGVRGVGAGWVDTDGTLREDAVTGERLSAGNYRVFFSGIKDLPASIALVNTVDDPTHTTAQCRVSSWGDAFDGTGSSVEVRCTRADGQDVDVYFTLVFGSTFNGLD